MTADESGVGVHVGDLLEEKTVGASIGGGGQNGGKVEGLADGGVGNDVVAEVVGAVVAHQLGETDLVVNHKKGLGGIVRDSLSHCTSVFLSKTYRIVLVDTVPRLNRGDSKSQGCENVAETHFEAEKVLLDWLWSLLAVILGVMSL